MGPIRPGNTGYRAQIIRHSFRKHTLTQLTFNVMASLGVVAHCGSNFDMPVKTGVLVLCNMMRLSNKYRFTLNIVTFLLRLD